MQSPFEGKLVRLRAHEPDSDVDTAYEWFNEYAVRRFLGSQYPFSQAAVRERMKQAPKYDLAAFAVVKKDDGQLIGDVGLFGAVAEDRAASLGIQIGDRRFWDAGYGTDTMRVTCQFGFAQMNLHRIQLEVLAENHRARHVYRKLGFREECVRRDAMFRRGQYMDIVVMGLIEGELVE